MAKEFLFVWREALLGSDLRPTLRHVALTMSTHTDTAGKGAFPGADRLARETGLNVATVRAARAELVDTGWLKLDERGGKFGETRRANAYTLTIPNRTPVVEDDGSRVATGEPERADPSSSLRRPVVQDDPTSDYLLDTSEREPDPFLDAARSRWSAVRSVTDSDLHPAIARARAAGLSLDEFTVGIRDVTYPSEFKPEAKKRPACERCGGRGYIERDGQDPLECDHRPVIAVAS